MDRRIITYFTVHPAVTFFVIFLLAFAIRFSLLMRHKDDIDAVGEEPRIAHALVSKGQFADPYAVPTGPTAHSTPFFPVVLAGIYKALGTGFAGQFASCLFIISGYSLLFALYPTFASAFGFPFEAGMFAGFLSALLPLRRSAEVFRGWEETWAAMALALLLFLTLKRYKSPARGAIGAAGLGVCWGAALYINFALSAVLVGLLLVEFLSNRRLRVLRDGALTLLSAELITENPSAFRHPGQSVPEAMLVRDMGELNYNRRDLHLALAWIESHPRNFIWLSIERFFFFWLGPLNHAYESIVISSYTILGFAGLAFVRKRIGEMEFRMWCTVLAFYPLMYYCVAFAHRYRVPIDWMIWLPAGLFVCVVLEKFAAEKVAVPVRAG
jgi:hypothetical protein